MLQSTAVATIVGSKGSKSFGSRSDLNEEVFPGFVTMTIAVDGLPLIPCAQETLVVELDLSIVK